jgi:hypothetical protein
VDESNTPGQRCYETFVRVGYPQVTADAADLWHTVPPHLRRAWEAAAQAVLALKQEEAPAPDA